MCPGFRLKCTTFNDIIRYSEYDSLICSVRKIMYLFKKNVGLTFRMYRL